MNTLIIWLLVLVCLAPVVLIVMLIKAYKEYKIADKELEQWESQRQN